MKAPLRTYRAEDDVYDPAKATAKLLGDSLSEVIRDALLAYTAANARRARRARGKLNAGDER